MGESPGSVSPMSASAKDFALRLLTIGENRFQLATAEVEEERDRLLCVLFLALSMAAFGLLTGITLTAVMVVLLWNYSHVAVLLALTGLYGMAAVCVCRRLARLTHDWETLSSSLDQLRKDRACLEKILE